MKPTARECGLKISSYVDERMDPQKSTKAAVRYLKQLYTMFGDWELVMAAYNAGPGRVRSAVKRAGSSNYWVMARYLPAETQSYVPGFIAASYLMNFHSAHNIMPVYPELAMNDLITVYVYEGMSITDAARRSGLTVDDLKRLNPTFVRNYIPASPTGYALMLPYASAELFNSGRSMEAPGMADNSFARSATVTIDGQTFTITTTSKDYVVRSGDNLYTIAQRNRCSVREIMTWNGLHDSRLAIGQRLELRFVTKELLPTIVEAVLSPVASRTNQKVNAMACLSLECFPTFRTQNVTFDIDPVVKVQGSNTLILQRRQSVRQAVHQYHLTSNITAKAFDFSSNIIPGDVVKVK
jgi:membrane-bound lytic murein transglycosylase D